MSGFFLSEALEITAGYFSRYTVGLLLPCERRFYVALLNSPKAGLAVCWERLTNIEQCNTIHYVSLHNPIDNSELSSGCPW